MSQLLYMHLFSFQWPKFISECRGFIYSVIHSKLENLPDDKFCLPVL